MITENLYCVDTARYRYRELIKEQGVGKEEFCERTGYSEGQYYRWMSTTHSNKAHRVTTHQLGVLCETLNWSPSYVLFGIGPKSLSELKTFFTGQIDNAAVSTAFEVAKENNMILREILNTLNYP